MKSEEDDSGLTVNTVGTWAAVVVAVVVTTCLVALVIAGTVAIIGWLI